jgi:hypothetical protein
MPTNVMRRLQRSPLFFLPAFRQLIVYRPCREPGRTETALRARENYERDADSGGRRNTELTRPLRVRGGKTKHTQAYPSPSASLNMPFNKRGEALPKFLKSKNARNKLRSARPNFRLLDHFTNFTVNKSEK